MTACDESCESTCSDGSNTGCDSCKEGYTQNEDQACVGKYYSLKVLLFKMYVFKRFVSNSTLRVNVNWAHFIEIKHM